MNQLFDHNQSLKSLYVSYANSSALTSDSQHTCLDHIDEVLRSVLTIEDMRQAGSFFTGDELAQELVNTFTIPITDCSIILDPTCGAGNLLLACSRKLSVSNKLSDTLKAWGSNLRGYDLYPSFVEATKLRIILEAISRGCNVDCSLEVALSFLKHIHTADALEIQEKDLSEITHTVMNPPFCSWPSPNRDFWKKGKVNAASLIIEHYLKTLPKKTQFGAILPEVLRCGSRYSQWRNFVNSSISASVRIVGRFNRKTDVDVFTLHGEISNELSNIQWQPLEIGNQTTIGELFDVSVGRLVAYRDPLEGPEHPYIHTKNVPAWKTIKDFDERRRFKGTVIKPPFVVIRRNSRPDDKYRAVGSLILGNEPIAVENHLIIIKPNSESISDCENLIKALKSKRTNNFLNSRIRCRHLTVGAVKQIPYD